MNSIIDIPKMGKGHDPKISGTQWLESQYPEISLSKNGKVAFNIPGELHAFVIAGYHKAKRTKTLHKFYTALGLRYGENGYGASEFTVRKYVNKLRGVERN